MATEEILMAGVQPGGDRQELHERIRVHSQAAAREVKELGRSNDLIDRLERRTPGSRGSTSVQPSMPVGTFGTGTAAGGRVC